MSAVSRELRTVLIVEDSEDDRYLLERALRKAGTGLVYHFVREVDEAIAYMKGEGRFSDRKAHQFPDVVVLDLGLQMRDGLELLEWIRATRGCEGLKVIVWTGSLAAESRGKAKELGATLYVEKGTDLDHFSVVVTAIARVVAQAGPVSALETECLTVR